MRSNQNDKQNEEGVAPCFHYSGRLSLLFLAMCIASMYFLHSRSSSENKSEEDKLLTDAAILSTVLSAAGAGVFGIIKGLSLCDSAGRSDSNSEEALGVLDEKDEESGVANGVVSYLTEVVSNFSSGEANPSFSQASLQANRSDAPGVLAAKQGIFASTPLLSPNKAHVTSYGSMKPANPLSSSSV
jgi:hypothetical protein